MKNLNVCRALKARGHKLGCQNRVFKLDTTEINESSFILPIGGFHTLTVYGLLLTKKN